MKEIAVPVQTIKPREIQSEPAQECPADQGTLLLL
jgi:hypothetical protein